ncbi:hypothetical protein BR93DRAFT_472857 [Coniochaeta sp. PMI_546]|nr:hypothetical protein BR93DRAFT_472857 [Coniochaeta sp. PMI_546]
MSVQVGLRCELGRRPFHACYTIHLSKVSAGTIVVLFHLPSSLGRSLGGLVSNSCFSVYTLFVMYSALALRDARSTANTSCAEVMSAHVLPI